MGGPAGQALGGNLPLLDGQVGQGRSPGHIPDGINGRIIRLHPVIDRDKALRITFHLGILEAQLCRPGGDPQRDHGQASVIGKLAGVFHLRLELNPQFLQPGLHQPPGRRVKFGQEPLPGRAK